MSAHTQRDSNDDDAATLATVARAWSAAGRSSAPIPAVVRVHDDGFPLESIPPRGRVRVHFADGTIGTLIHVSEGVARSIRAHYGLPASNVDHEDNGDDDGENHCRGDDDDDSNDDDEGDHLWVTRSDGHVVAHTHNRHPTNVGSALGGERIVRGDPA